MRHSYRLTGSACLLAFASLSWAADATMWYDKPATDWEKEALPIGNGRIGAMVFGGVESERLQISEKSLWTGGPGSDGGYDYGLPAESQADAMRGVSQQLLGGATLEPEGVAKLLGRKMRNYGDYQSFGDLIIELEQPAEATPVRGYRRELDLAAGVARVSFKQGMVGYRREYFVSYPDQVLVGRWYSTSVQKLRIHYAVPDNRSAEVKLEPGSKGARLVVTGALKSNGLAYAVELLVVPDCGTLRADADSLRFEGDCAVTFVLAARTNYRLHYPDYRDAAANPGALAHGDANTAAVKPYPTLARRHAEDYRELFSRVDLDLGGTPGKVPTDVLRSGYGSGNAAADRALAVVFQIWPLPADLLVARRRAAREPARRVERQGHAAVECRLPRQHQPADELLAGGSRESSRDRHAAVRFRGQPHGARQARGAALFRRAGMDDVPQHQRVGLRRAHRLAHRVLATGGRRLAGAALLRALSIHAR